MIFPKLAACERPTAGPRTPWHIRLVGPEGLRQGGGVPGDSLCGRSLNRGWDLQLIFPGELLQPGGTAALVDRCCLSCLSTVDQLLMEHLDLACEVMHDAYEAAAAGYGWETQQASRKPWADVPDTNKATMRAAVAALLRHLGN